MLPQVYKHHIYTRLAYLLTRLVLLPMAIAIAPIALGLMVSPVVVVIVWVSQFRIQ